MNKRGGKRKASSNQKEYHQFRINQFFGRKADDEKDEKVENNSCCNKFSGTVEVLHPLREAGATNNVEISNSSSIKNYPLVFPFVSETTDSTNPLSGTNTCSIPATLETSCLSSSPIDCSPLPKKLSLKIRKRKHKGTTPPDCCVSNADMVPKSKEGVSDNDSDILALYAASISATSTGENDIADGKECIISSRLLLENYPAKSLHSPGNIPACPSFSPGKNTLKSFSPVLQERKRARLETEIDSSASTNHIKLGLPSYEAQSMTSSKRVLFPSDSPSVNHPSNISSSEDLVSDLLSYSGLFSDLEESLQSNETCLTRYLVMEKVTQMSSNTDRPRPEVVLRLFDESNKFESMCYLRDDWITTDVEAGDIVQLNAEYDEANSCFTVNSSTNLSSLVVNPDLLLSSTTIANSITCVRRSVLSERFKIQQSSEVMLIGQLLHELFQRVLLRLNKSNFQHNEIEVVIREESKNVVSTVNALDKLFSVGMSEFAAHEALVQQTPAIVWWCGKYLSSPTGETHAIKPPLIDTGASIAITEVLDIEESIWSPRYGLKGKIDVSVSVNEGFLVNQPAMGENKGSRVPLELKTGKMFRKQGTIEHRSQVALYTLMMSDRYSTQPPGGLLYYLKGQHMQALPSLPHELRGLIIARNGVSHYLSPSGDHLAMPGLLKDKFTCKHCPQAKACMFYHRAMENGDPVSSGVEDLYVEHVSLLSTSQMKFFSNWYSLAAVEEAQNRMKDQIPIWLSNPEESEKGGSCIANMLALSVNSCSPFQQQAQIFIKAPGFETVNVLSTSEAVVISRQDGSGWALSTGAVTQTLANGGVEVLVDKILQSDDNVLYRIDTINSFGRGSMTGSLMHFCTSDSERVEQLRKLIIDHRPPRFKTLTSLQQDQLNSADSIVSDLNTNQKKALLKVMSSEDYTLILGMPGTGKTSAIAALVKILVAVGKSVLVTSYTHSAVDNILLKLKNEGVSFIRLGSTHRVHPSLQEFTPTHICKGFSTSKQLESVYLNTPVVGTTCLGVRHGLFARRAFDMCIIDEASQITLPISISPLCYSSRFVLVGDPYQLPPLVISQQAREGGLDVSLFRYLCEKHPSAVVCLEQQYRMNREIMSLSNKLIYNNKLSCGSETVAKGRLTLPHLALHPVNSLIHDCSLCAEAFHCSWMRRVIDPLRPVVFVNTDTNQSSVESITGGHTYNLLEADVLTQAVTALILLGLTPDKIGIITPFCYQKNIIKQKIKSSGLTKDCDIEVNTIDKYQGRDKECILVSFVRNNPKGNTGPLLKDWRRLNVALTRAKHKLILVGSRATLSKTPLLKNLLVHLLELNCTVSI